jgi:hypothetical protein
VSGVCGGGTSTVKEGHLGGASAIRLVANWGRPPNLLVLHAIHSEVTPGPPPAELCKRHLDRHLDRHSGIWIGIRHFDRHSFG